MTIFEKYIRQTFLIAVRDRAEPYFTMRSPYQHNNIIDFSEAVQNAFGWKIWRMTRTQKGLGKEAVYGTLAFAEVVGDDLKNLFLGCNMAPYFVFTTNSVYREFRNTKAWAFDPAAVTYNVTFSVADPSRPLSLQDFYTAIETEITLMALKWG
jgi:hypothetical protein